GSFADGGDSGLTTSAKSIQYGPLRAPRLRLLLGGNAMSRSTRHVITSEWIDLAEGGLPTGTLETIDFETESSVALLAPPRRPAPIAWEDDEDEDEDFLDDDEDLDLGD